MPNKPHRPHDGDSTFHRYRPGDVGETSPSLIDRLQNREDQATEAFVNIYSKLVRFWCRKANEKLSKPLLRDERKDISSEVIAKAVRKLCEKNTEPIRNLRAWLRRITQNCINDVLRKRKKLPVQPSDSNVIDNFADKEVALEANEELEDMVILKQIIKRIQPLFRAEHWDVYQHAVVEGMTSEEVAKILNLTGANVRQIKSRILKKIRQEYDNHGMEDELPKGMPVE